MSQALGRGFRGLSGVPVFSRARQGVVVHRGQSSRYVQIRAAPSGQPGTINGAHLPVSGVSTTAESPDARFDVVGAPYSLLSVSLSASQNLYTRRGTLVGLSGKAENVVSTLSILEPFRRAVVGIPFLYQKVSSTSPVTALISVRSPVTSFAVVQLNGTVDWMVAQRRALLAWTGHNLLIRPTVNTNLSVTHWGSSEVTGRGLLALVGNGQIYSVELKPGEQYIAHPSNVIAYTMTSHPPLPYRFKSTTLKLQIPGLSHVPRLFRKSKFINDMAHSDTWKTTMKIYHNLRTWARRTIWGDRLFLQFEGPTTILVQSRGPRVSDVLTTREVNEIADSPAGATHDAVKLLEQKQQPTSKNEPKSEVEKAVDGGASDPEVPKRSAEQLVQEVEGTRQSFARVTRDGKVEFQKPGKGN
ncbi:hypothetical protein DTO169C6_5153 [Paecilomyces variotii]|nr:hypothetical protein DTO169C6_5153 [Paecilomyces variotii]KAJ9398808.1 hypothetical protein DTO282F9_4160 [Paecilomyces variotii]